MSIAAFLGWQSYEWWIVAIGALACASAGLVGCFLVLRKMSLMGDAITHSVLPGIAVAVMISGEVNSWQTLLGATLVGVLTPYLVDLLRSSGRLHEDASMGVVFTVLFSIGVILVARIEKAHIDVDCILQGEIAMAPFDVLRWGGVELGPRSFWILAFVFLTNLLFVGFFYKELKLSTFDPALAKAMGMRPKLIHYLLLGMVSLTTIAAFESVGSILMVAMLIAPGAAAYLLTDRLGVMLLLSVAIGALSSVFGYVVASGVGQKVSIAGCIACAAGSLFLLSFLFSPRYGVVLRWWRRRRLAWRLTREHILSLLYRVHESQKDWLGEDELFAHRFDKPSRVRRAGARLLQEGLLIWENGRLRLTTAGLSAAEGLVRAHRLWEAYLEQRLGIPADHVHRSADDTEHFLSPQLQEEIAQSLAFPEQDPHGKPIPGARRNTPPPASLPPSSTSDDS